MPRGVYIKSEEHRRNLGDSLRQRYNSDPSKREAARDRMLAHYATPAGELHRETVSRALAGIVRSPETRAKVSAAQDKNTIEDMWMNVEKSEGCWLYNGTRHRQGYGQISLGGSKETLVHRIVWSVIRGPIPGGMQVLHKCDNPPCCNPDHLFLGTIQDNMADMAGKKRQRHGEQHRDAKLKAHDVIDIRSLWNDGRSAKDIAKRFGISTGPIYKIVNGVSWRHVPGEITRTVKKGNSTS